MPEEEKTIGFESTVGIARIDISLVTEVTNGMPFQKVTFDFCVDGDVVASPMVNVSSFAAEKIKEALESDDIPLPVQLMWMFMYAGMMEWVPTQTTVHFNKCTDHSNDDLEWSDTLTVEKDK